jgi:hypothetical protein
MYTNWKKYLWGVMLAAFSLVPAAQGWTQEPPRSIELVSLSQYYAGVVFDHAMHADLGESCAVCHHHGTGAPVQDENCARCHSNAEKTTVVTCKECHPVDPFSAEYLRVRELDVNLYHRDKPGLKAAYHQNCMGCHEQMGGPTGCQDCHTRNEAGDALFHAGAFAPQQQAAPTHH